MTMCKIKEQTPLRQFVAQRSGKFIYGWNIAAIQKLHKLHNYTSNTEVWSGKTKQKFDNWLSPKAVRSLALFF